MTLRSRDGKVYAMDERTKYWLAMLALFLITGGAVAVLQILWLRWT